MDFYAVLDQVLALLRQRGRVSYRALKRQFDLDDAYLDDLKVELIEVQQCARDQEGTMLVWTGQDTSAAAPAPIQSQAPLVHTPPHLAEKILTSRSALEGERKQVTVLFADLKGSTELIAGLDPEEARRLLDPALHVMMDAVHRYEGTVNQVLGDGIMALFGAPLAHEDHALRACYAALAMQTAMRHYAERVRHVHGLEVQIRVGLNSGEVVVRAIGNDLHMDYSAVGQTTHLAARMEQLATPGTIRLTAATLRLVEGLVRVTALGAFPVKGLPAPVEVFELVGATAFRRRLQATAAQGLTRFVGRQTELATLRQVLEWAGSGHGQVVALVGEAGVGKSRLVYEFAHSHRTRGWRVLESASVSYGKATPYFPVIDLLKRYAGVEEQDDARTIRAKVTGQVLTLDATLQETVPALLWLLEALPPESPFVTLDPVQRRQQTLDALTRVLLRESRAQPLVLVFEDLHWIDSETHALLDRLVDRLPTATFLLLVNYRPEYQHGWGGKPYYTQLRLDPLPPTDAEAVLQALLGDDPALVPLKQVLIARTEGNPFFLEESIRTLAETGVLVGVPGAYRLAQALPTIQVPATVHAVLAARLDRLLPEHKRLLQTAAVIGTEVPLALLQAIAGLPEAALHRGLAALQTAEFLYEARLFPEVVYAFKHALTHEVTYGSLLQERRRALHASIVAALEALSPERRAELVDRLAHHAWRGQVWDKALVYCQQAGAKALARSAYHEAVGYLEQALAAVPHLPESRALYAQAIDLHLELRNALVPFGDLGRQLRLLREAEVRAEALGDPRRLGRIAFGLAQLFYQAGDPARAIAAGQRILASATTLGDVGLEVMAHYVLGRSYESQGDYRRAIEFLRRNVVALTGERVREHFGMAGLPAVQSRYELVCCLAALGEFAEGRTIGGEGLRIAEAVAHPHSITDACIGLGYLYLHQGALDHAIQVLERGLALCQHADIWVYFPQTAAYLGAAYALADRMGEAVSLLEQAMERETALGRMVYRARILIWLSEAYLLAGRREAAHPLAERAIALTRTHRGRGWETWALWLFGKLAAQQEPSDVELAASFYHQALTLAHELGMRPLQAHCHRGLGTLYATTGQREQARTELSTAIEMYRSMEMTFWLPQAEAALAQVEGR